MNIEKKNIAKLLKSVAVPLGYVQKGSVLFKKNKELITLIELQRSRFCPGTYVNIGVIPNERFDPSPRPPDSSSWELRDRGESILEEPFGDVFLRLSNGEADRITEKQLGEAFRQLIAWMEINLCDADVIRNNIDNPSSRISYLSTLKLKDWCRKTRLSR